MPGAFEFSSESYKFFFEKQDFILPVQKNLRQIVEFYRSVFRHLH